MESCQPIKRLKDKKKKNNNKKKKKKKKQIILNNVSIITEMYGLYQCDQPILK
jgi:hypothetical protein